jgi:hypothetical protein
LGVIGLDIFNAANITRLRLRGNNDAGAFIIHNESMATRMFYETGATFELRTADLDELLDGTLTGHVLRWTCDGDGNVTNAGDLDVGGNAIIHGGLEVLDSIVIQDDGYIGSDGTPLTIQIDGDGVVFFPAGEVRVDNVLYADSDLNVGGDLDVNGVTRLGNAAGDTHTIWGVTTIGDNGSTNNIGISATGIQIFNGLAAINGLKIKRTSVTSSPYTVLSTDDHISITTASVAITVNLPAIVNGKIYHIKDQDGNAAGNNITVSPDGSDTIENAASLTISTNGVCITLIGNSTTNNWEIQ